MGNLASSAVRLVGVFTVQELASAAWAFATTVKLLQMVLIFGFGGTVSWQSFLGIADLSNVSGRDASLDVTCLCPLSDLSIARGFLIYLANSPSILLIYLINLFKNNHITLDVRKNAFHL